MFTLLNMWQWDNTIFDNIDIPEEFNHDDLVSVIMQRNEECALRQPHPELFKNNVETWFRYKKPIFQKLWETMNYEYNPIENYDRKEEYIRDNLQNGVILSTDNNARKNKEDVSESTVLDGQEIISGNETIDSTGKVTKNIDNSDTFLTSAFNETTWANKDKTERKEKDIDDTIAQNKTVNRNDNSHHDDNTRNENITRGDNDVSSHTNENYNNASEKFKTRAHGNIGVTTTQQMIESERNVVKFHVYDYIAREFESQFCLLVY